MYDLLGSMLFANGTPARSIDADVGSARLLERAVAYIDTNHTDSELTIQRMAVDLKASSRQLQRAFTSLDITPTEYLLQKRLASACEALKQQRMRRCGAGLPSDVSRTDSSPRAIFLPTESC
ncbi:helix-turn-helix transcriptional regulator [Hydrogenophaga sp. A37]|uniref:helix-turn-helix transcriptional regulator n=1 Tax=Hydrogenophaga sp. A37 TaxID=1945864 RepID=UPI0009875828|nr:helix-turn-helix transcriptional regulator [Hydrogenophaga sp. A37]OOG80381.1 hypothetical protein B0E41_20980 [Hydrogenophaga sp. A37]